MRPLQVFSMNEKPWWDWDAEKEVRRRGPTCLAGASAAAATPRGVGCRRRAHCCLPGSSTPSLTHQLNFLLKQALSDHLCAPCVQEWGWSRDPPVSQKTGGSGTGARAARKKVR